MMPIAIAKTRSSPPGIGLTIFLLLKKFHRVSKKRGIINRAISERLLSLSHATEKPAINAEIAGFQPLNELFFYIKDKNFD
jgi:hypothetical protein